MRIAWRTIHGAYVTPIATGLLITAAGVVPLLLLAPLNARMRPDIPWAATVMVLYLAILLMWLDGWGPPRRIGEHRRQRLRLRPASRSDPHGSATAATVVIVLLFGLLTTLWIAIGRASPIPDLTAYPTTSYRWSMFIIGGVTAGVVEEAAFRGYMQTGIERHDAQNAVLIPSLVFASSHITHGLGAVLMLGPGIFVAGMLYGTLARRTGTIVPGMLIHVAGDLAYTYFAVLRGDSSLLFVR